MQKQKKPFKKTFTILENAALPTEQQKEKMLDQVLLEYRYCDSAVAKIGRLITVYPWRFAFGFSTIQAVICTMIWGTRYTNIFLGIFGG